MDNFRLGRCRWRSNSHMPDRNKILRRYYFERSVDCSMEAAAAVEAVEAAAVEAAEQCKKPMHC